MEEAHIHWADVVARAVEGKQVIATGITPSGNIHVGNMREVVTGDAIFRAIGDAEKTARLIYIADTYDPLRTVYPFLPAAYKKYTSACRCQKYLILLAAARATLSTILGLSQNR